MTVSQVDGHQVSGRIERGGTARVAFDFVGTFEGNTLTIQGSMGRTELTVRGDQVRGCTIGPTRIDITMTRTAKK
jgi:hypothetical protein